MRQLERWYDIEVVYEGRVGYELFGELSRILHSMVCCRYLMISICMPVSAKDAV